MNGDPTQEECNKTKTAVDTGTGNAGGGAKGVEVVLV